ncbi:MAG: 30S ribosomal protein S16 [Anaerolineae bacterium]|nr:30S ribosomal protein S16 [Anaerolineae bacterium]
MVRIRLARVGLKKQPSYRIVVTDKRNARDGSYLEIIGFYNPRTRPDTEIVKEDRALYWLSVGAQPSEAVESIFVRTGTNDRYARLKSGNATIEELVAEVEANPREMPDPRTNYPAPAAGQSKLKAREAAAAAAEAAAQEAEEAAE